MWGSDYPHVEGTFLHPNDPQMPSVTRLFAAQHCSNTSRLRTSSRWLAGTPSRSNDLDRDALERIATEIDAPTIKELRTPIEGIPEGASTHAFRSGQTGWS
jgi:hypothetical protein